MKTVKRALALVLALTLLLAMSATVFAADDTYTITISGDNVVEGHTYEAYQIFKGDLAEKDSKTILSNIEWGSGVNGDALLTALKADTTLGNDFKDCTTAAQVADVLATYGSDAEKTQQFAKLAGANLNATVAGTSTWNGSGTNYSISSLAPGYYLVKDEDDSAPSSDAYTRYILQVVHNVTVNAKTDVPTVDKNIKDNGETTKVNEASIGDTINYEVTSKVPDMTGYTKYFFVLNDTMSKGLTFNNDVAVTIGGTTLGDDKYTVAYNTDTVSGITTIEIVIKDFINYTKGDAILVTYSATLNQDANLDPSVGNPNEVKLVYSNNPNVVGTGDTGNPDKPAPGDATGETPKSETKTYVTGIKLTKVDGQNKNQTLTGAKFEIKGDGMKVVLVNNEMYKESAKGTYYMLKDGTYTTTVPVTDKNNAGYNADPYDDTSKKYEKVDVVTKDTALTKINATGYVDANGVLTFKGLGEGTYTIKEIVAPNGYNLLKDEITISIAADAKLTGCTWNVTDSNSNALNVDSNHLYELTVENNAGAELPSTGGIGTTVFYVLGGLLVVCAGVLLITKRRMNKNA